MGGGISLRQLNRATLKRQGLADRHHGPVPEVVGRLAGLQAQHANSPYVALWSRRAGQAIADLETALVGRSVVKATLMRSTLHLVDAATYPHYDAATAGPRLANWAPTAARAGVDLLEMNRVVRSFCSEPRLVSEIEAHLDSRFPGRLSGDHVPAGVRNTGFRMAAAAGGLVHVPPSGLWKSHDKPRYLDHAAWLGDLADPSPDEALAVVVERYLGSHGPVTIGDIVKWTGSRKVTAVRSALAALGDRIVRVDGPTGVEMFDLAGLGVPDTDAPAPPRFLSRWDSVLIAYEDRERILPASHKDAVIKKNGDFLPTFLVDGFVAGLWSVDAGRHEAVLRLEPFGPVGPSERAALESQGEALLRYLELEAADHAIAWVA